jgi:HD-GYP domain-containing protein (c-di-GMP phosphodiesterase class II)
VSTPPTPVPDAGHPGAGEAVLSEDRELQRAGRELLFALYAALRVLRMYPLENQTVQNALRELDALSRQLLASEGGVSLRYVGDFVFVNDLRLRIDLGSFATFGGVGRALRRHGIGQLDVLPGADAAEWTALLSLLLSEPDGDDPFPRFLERLARTSIRNLVPVPEQEQGTAPRDEEDARDAAKRTYAQTVAVAREVLTGVRMGKGASMRKVKRAVQSIVDQVLSNETSITGMTTLRDYDEYTFTHSVNVCIFSVALGKKLGLGKHELYDLGLGGLLHDVGKVRMPVEVINKAGPLDERERELMQEHPTEGFLAIFDMRGFSELPLRAMLCIYEHHMKPDGTGYPRCIRPRDPTLFPRIVAVADAFDAATTKRSYQSEPWLPDQALKEMRDNPKRGLDPLLVKAFISMTGIYPVGSVVILDSYELGVVVAPNPRPEALHQPLVRILYDSMGRIVDPPLTVDLAEPAPGEPARTIIKTTDPERYGIHVGSHFV